MDLEQIRQAARLRNQPLPLTTTNVEESPEEEQDEEVLNNEDHCFKCKRRGEIFCCDNCYRSFHAEGCMSVRPTENIWSCPCCQLRDVCPVCEVSVGMHDHSEVCSLCSRKTHYPCTGLPKHLLKPLSNDLTFATESYFICYDCIYSSEVRCVVATEEVAGQGQFSLVLPYFCSTAHLGWISDYNLRSISNKPRKIKHVANTLNQPFLRAYVDRIIAMKPAIAYQNVPSYEHVRLLRDSTRRIEQGHPSNFKFLVKWRNLTYEQCTWEDEFLMRQSPCMALENYIRMKEFELYYLLEKSAQLRDFRIRPLGLEPLEPREEILLTEMVESYHAKQPIVLNKWIADRKCQTVIAAFLSHLHYYELLEQPILVVAKYREFATWLSLFEQFCPGMYVVNLVGLQQNRLVIKTRELYYEEAGVPKFHIMLTSFECLGKDSSMFYNKEINVKWGVMVYDDEMRCDNFIAGRPGSQDIYRVILARDFSYEEVRQVLNVLTPSAKSIPATVDGDSMVKFVRQWIPNSFLQWPEFTLDLKAKVRTTVPKKSLKTELEEESAIKNDKAEGTSVQADKNESRDPELPSKEKGVSLRGRPPKNKPPAVTPSVATLTQSNPPPPNPPVLRDRDIPWPRFKRIAFLRFVLSFGLDFSSYNALAEQLEQFESEIFQNNPSTLEELKIYVRTFLKMLTVETAESSRRLLFRLEPSAVLRRICDIKNFRKAFFKYSPTPDKFPFRSEATEIASEDGLAKKQWGARENLLLIQLVLRHGYDNWQEICESKEWQDPERSGSTSIDILFEKLWHNTESAPQPTERLRVCCREASLRTNLIMEFLRSPDVNLE